MARDSPTGSSSVKGNETYLEIDAVIVIGMVHVQQPLQCAECVGVESSSENHIFSRNGQVYGLVSFVMNSGNVDWRVLVRCVASVFLSVFAWLFVSDFLQSFFESQTEQIVIFMYMFCAKGCLRWLFVAHDSVVPHFFVYSCSRVL